MKFISHENIRSALSLQKRIYLTGHLKRPQDALQHIDDDVEIGISFYQVFTSDKLHYHVRITEHWYVLEGIVKLLIVDNNKFKEMQFFTGDFVVIPPGTIHVTKNAPGTKVLFVKAPSENDIVEVPVPEEVSEWMNSL